MLMEASGSRSKRPHTEVDDCDECLPISKRINRLHIEAQRKSQGDEQPPCAHQQHQVNCHGMNNNNIPQASTSWQNRMAQHPNCCLSPSLALTSNSGTMSNEAAQYQSMPHNTMYQPMSGVPQNSNDMTLLHSPVLQNPGFPVQQQFSQHSPTIPNLNAQFQQDPQGSFPEAVTSMDFEYDPELGENENPHYFHINHVLFNAHCQRLRRDGFSTHPDPASFS